MSRQIIGLVTTFCIGVTAFAQSGDKPTSSLGQAQERRSAQRFSIIDWVRNNEQAKYQQNAKWGRAGGKDGPYPDLTLTYSQETNTVKRSDVALGKDTRFMGRIQFFLDDLVKTGTKTRSFNVDVGAEGFYDQTTNFSPDTGVTQAGHAYTDYGGGLIFRPFGRSSQDTGLILKGGYLNMTETGLWTASQTQVSTYGIYLGGEVKIYLLDFLGLRGEYQTVLEQDVRALSSKWKMQRFTYGAFLGIWIIDLGAYLVSSEMVLTPTGGTAIKDTSSGLGFEGSLHF